MNNKYCAMEELRGLREFCVSSSNEKKENSKSIMHKIAMCIINLFA